MLIALGFAAVAAVAVGLATTVVVRLQHIEAENAERELQAYKADSEAKISAAEAVGHAAQADIAKAHAQIAEANARQKEAELKLEQIRSKIGPRIIDKDKLVGLLKGKLTSAAAIMYSANVPDGFATGQQLVNALREAGWKAFVMGAIPPNSPFLNDAPNLYETDANGAVIGTGSGLVLISPEGEMYSPESGPRFETAYESLSMAIAQSMGSTGGRTDPSVQKGLIYILIFARL
ncbi:hypothetical protein [Bradyrhizobium ottawaense]|uniref:hypothetical protein n=1 Tax=Bradyrhizobium ottawaense TaxID=931866 RepID=UPI001BAA4610|nr:hypothetical protein [Bradyrhizobium ottawaense]MBR1362942.1 hypothetical protein [Bradyrhizobium ottawaense]